MAWVAGLLVANSSFILGIVLWTSQGLYTEFETESVRYSRPMTDTSLFVWTAYNVCSLPWVQDILAAGSSPYQMLCSSWLQVLKPLARHGKLISWASLDDNSKSSYWTMVLNRSDCQSIGKSWHFKWFSLDQFSFSFYLTLEPVPRILCNKRLDMASATLTAPPVCEPSAT